MKKTTKEKGNNITTEYNKVETNRNTVTKLNYQKKEKKKRIIENIFMQLNC